MTENELLRELMMNELQSVPYDDFELYLDADLDIVYGSSCARHEYYEIDNLDLVDFLLKKLGVR